jgi:hypothetical protein
MASTYDTLMARLTDTPHSLDQYLQALWEQSKHYHELETLPIDLCLEWFIEALNAPVPTDLTPISSPNEEFNQWQNMVLGFAATFAEVKDIPQDDPFEFHGWMNTHPSAFLERGVAGSLGDEEEFEALTWEILRDLLWSGKYYE